MSEFREQEPQPIETNFWLKIKYFLDGIKDVFNGLSEEERTELQKRAEIIKELLAEFNELRDSLSYLVVKDEASPKAWRRITEIEKELKKMGMNEADIKLLGFNLNFKK